jgi:hypothetical protein
MTFLYQKLTGTESNQGLVRGMQRIDNVKVLNPVQDFIKIMLEVIRVMKI